ncbi:hypothetical protein [Hanstruepera marina]|uniref:hypothetical protein n=1 Tax=Hanstruepera marina TaxID=2873265 RepID=UPI001CA68267|nr:hypothetical protein [Hanstruepera marina]
MKTILITLVTFFTIQTFGQERLSRFTERTIDSEAKALATEYNKELSLNDDQIRIFEIKIDKFLKRRKQLESNLVGRELLTALYHVRMKEINEMSTILTYNQLKTYDKVKQELQPLQINNRVLSTL